MKITKYELNEKELNNDKLWETEDEDLDFMAETYDRIAKHYHDQGVEFWHELDRANGEQMMYLGESQEQFQYECDNGEGLMPGYAASAIRAIHDNFID